jgi:hypothetical protein
MVSSLEEDDWVSKLKEKGMEQVKRDLAAQRYGEEAGWKVKTARRYLYEEEQKIDTDLKQKQITLSEEAIEVAREANRISREANIEAKKANDTSRLALIISIISAVAATALAVFAWMFHK